MKSLFRICLALAAILLTNPAGAAEINFLHYWTGPLKGGVEEMARSFNQESPEVKLIVRDFEHESFKVGIQAMLTTKTPPDLFSYWAGAKVQALVDKEQLAPMDDVWRSAKLSEVFPPNISTACRYNGRYYAIPLTRHFVTFFYNKALFQKAGLKPPKTWAQFIDACFKLKTSGITPIALGAQDRWPAQFWFDYILLRTAGAEYRSRLLAGEASYTDPEVFRAFRLWKQLLDAGYFNPTPNVYTWADAAKMVRTGEAAMTLMGTWIIGLFDGQLKWNQDKDYGWFSFPQIGNRKPVCALGPVDVIVAAAHGDSKNTQPVLQYFAKPGPQMAMSRGSGALAPSSQVPLDFYTPLQAEMINYIDTVPEWAFNYDLATKPEAANAGLDAFAEFIRVHTDPTLLLEQLEATVKALKD